MGRIWEAGIRDVIYLHALERVIPTAALDGFNWLPIVPNCKTPHDKTKKP